MKNDSLILEEILLSWKRCAKMRLIASIDAPMVYIKRNVLQQKLFSKKNYYCHLTTS